MRYIILVLTLLALLLPIAANSEILVEDNFDDWPDFYANQFPELPWCQSCGATGTILSETLDTVTHSPTEVTSTGVGGVGKSLKTWRHGSTWTGNTYWGSLGLRTLGDGTHKFLYMRFYMKVPATMTFPQSQKLWRFNTTSGEIYFDFYDGENIQVCPNSSGVDCFADGEYLAPLADWKDGEWHSHQLYVDLNTATLTYWLDGEQTYTKTGMANFPAATEFFGTGTNFIQHFPIGNTFNAPYQASWLALEVDNFVIATTKAETDPIQPTTPLRAGARIDPLGRESITAGSTPVN